MEKEKNVLEKWFEFSQEELETELSEEDKSHLYDFEKSVKAVLTYLDGEAYQFVKEKLDKLEKEILDNSYYFNRKYYMIGFMDVLEIILKVKEY